MGLETLEPGPGEAAGVEVVYAAANGLVKGTTTYRTRFLVRKTCRGAKVR